MIEKMVGIRELKINISQILKATQKGESVIITFHGKPLARIVPYIPEEKDEISEIMEMESIDWNGHSIGELKPVGYNTSGKLVSDIVTELRE